MIRWSARVPLIVGVFVVFSSLAISAQTPTHYRIDVDVDYAAGTFHGQATVDVTNDTDSPSSELFFRLFANDALTYGSAFVHVSDVTIQTTSVPFSMHVDDTVVLVPLSTPLAPGKSVAITLAYEGQSSFWPANQPNGSEAVGYGLLTKSESAMTLTTFYPLLAIRSKEGWSLSPGTGFGDLLSAEAADYDVRLTLDDSPIPVTTGRIVSAEEVADTITYSIQAQDARDISIVLVDPSYVTSESQATNTIIRTWFTADHEAAGIQANDLAASAADLYGRLVAPCPFPEVELVEVPLRYAAGVEFSGLILVGEQYAERPRDTFFTIIVSHEMGHQWFYAGVGDDAIEHPWLDEGFATYLSYEFLYRYSSPAVAEAQRGTWRDTYQRAQQEWPHLTINDPTYAYPNSSIYSAFVYSGGATLLSTLRAELGDDLFYQAIQTYYKRFLHRIAIPSDLFGAFEDACGCDLDALLSPFGIER